MIVADRLGIPMEHVHVRAVRHRRGAARRRHGGLAFAAARRQRAVPTRARRCSRRPRRLAAHLLEANADDIVRRWTAGLGVAGVPARALTWAELAAASKDTPAPAGMEPRSRHALDFNQDGATFPFGAHVAVVEVDLETGAVDAVRHVAVDDCGRILNPLLVAGQQHGGIAQGIAQALWEAVRLRRRRQPADRDAHRLRDAERGRVPELRGVEHRDAVAAATRSARRASASRARSARRPRCRTRWSTRCAHLGVRHIDMPCTPERVWTAIEAARA